MSKEKFSDSVSVFIELLEVSIHCILYARKIYPEGIFELKKKYNVPVHVKKLRQVDICFYNRFGKAIERFVINIHKIELELDFSDIQNLRDPYLVKLEQMLRALCLKLTVCDSMLNPLPSECTFLIHVHTTETASIEVQKHTEGFPLIPSEDKLTQLNSPSIIPMRSIECEYLKLEIYVEEGIKDEDPDLFTPSPLL
ncbi:mitotic spindle assembly checkpoint protein MAD2B isoform X2 [Daktulosphaira vitifoliae]|uniref:mitotic spindle assembly checkpoint protein MAD2B isoform X2 n=1 Tax=Daktulosphaira vitifoliae TaxID=58002 RepID=UPI0021AA4441|nr:mitotic spindle assembly checkpoint protein MAD2B isoform X2 [Daktulosphaira vitifoliae]